MATRQEIEILFQKNWGAIKCCAQKNMVLVNDDGAA
jgi:hypothetical protein